MSFINTNTNSMYFEYLAVFHFVSNSLPTCYCFLGPAAKGLKLIFAKKKKLNCDILYDCAAQEDLLVTLSTRGTAPEIIIHKFLCSRRASTKIAKTKMRIYYCIMLP